MSLDNEEKGPEQALAQVPEAGGSLADPSDPAGSTSPTSPTGPTGPKRPTRKSSPGRRPKSTNPTASAQPVLASPAPTPTPSPAPQPSQPSQALSLVAPGTPPGINPNTQPHAYLIGYLKLSPIFRDALRLNLMGHQIVATRPLPWQPLATEWRSRCPDHSGLPWSDVDSIELAAHVQVALQMRCTPILADQAVLAVAAKSAFHPVREYLNSLTWDGTPRISRWLTTYCGVESSTYTEAVGQRWLISSVARALTPGCKADHMLVLGGAGGVRKSTALAILGGPWFNDDIVHFSNKDTQISVARSWIVEISELDAVSKSSIELVKAFISRTIDIYRPPYGRHAISQPRQVIFAGTTNQLTYLKDLTGNRRFWPVECQEIHEDRLRQDRDQLWAEAVVEFRKGTPWHLETEELCRLAEAEQWSRTTRPEWADEFCDWISDLPPEINFLTTKDIFQQCEAFFPLSQALEDPSGKYLYTTRRELGELLRANGWKLALKKINRKVIRGFGR